MQMKKECFEQFKWKRTTLKYKYIDYPNHIKELLDKPINKNDEKALHKIYNNYKALGISRGYEYIIKDLYLLFRKHKFTVKELAKIYNLSPNTMRIYIRELNLRKKKRT